MKPAWFFDNFRTSQPISHATILRWSADDASMIDEPRYRWSVSGRKSCRISSLLGQAILRIDGDIIFAHDEGFVRLLDVGH